MGLSVLAARWLTMLAVLEDEGRFGGSKLQRGQDKLPIRIPKRRGWGPANKALAGRLGAIGQATTTTARPPVAGRGSARLANRIHFAPM